MNLTAKSNFAWCVVVRQYLAPFFCLLLGVVVSRHASAAETSSGWQKDSDLEPEPVAPESKVSEEPMLVVSPTGVLHAVDPVTRQTLWTIASGSDMGSVLRRMYGKRSREINDIDEGIAFSGPDGKLYVLKVSQVGHIAIDVKDLLENRPHHTNDGAVVLSSVTTTAFLLNKDTGALIRKFDSPGTTMLANAAQSEDAERLLKQQTSDINNTDNSGSTKKVPTVLCFRTDHSVIVQELDTGAVRWNISLVEIKTLSLGQPSEQQPTPMLRPTPDANANNGVIASPVLGGGRTSPIPSYQAALFSSPGECLSNLSSDPGRKPGPLSDSMRFGKPSSKHRAQPNTRSDAGVISVPAGVAHDVYTKGGFSEQKSLGAVPSLDNSHDRVTLRAGHYVALGSVGGFVLVVMGLLFWFVYNRSVSRRSEMVTKPKKVGASKCRKRGIKCSSSVSSTSTPTKGLAVAEDNITQGIPTNLRLSNEGIQVGRLFVSKVLIGDGSNGTSVFEGRLDSRRVAVKRLLAHHHERAVKEIEFLIASDEHPNVVRYFAMEDTPDFVYVALEKCASSLHDLIVSEKGRPGDTKKYLKMPDGTEVKLWNNLGRCSPQLQQLMRDTAAGLAHLHAVGIVHRDLKPHNVLVSNQRKLQAKLADMGLSKHLDHDVSSFQNTDKGGSGSRGWQAPEQLTEGRQTRAVDVFSLGCLFFFCVSRGRHAYGQHLFRDGNIVNGNPNLFFIQDMPEALDLIKPMLSHDPSKRPAAKDILSHPFFWNAEDRLEFLMKASDRMEHEDRAPDSVLLTALEAVGPAVFRASWGSKLNPKLLEDGRRYRIYNFSSLGDLLRIIRNKVHHFRELPLDIQEMVESPEDFEAHITAKCPRLLMEVYKVVQDYCKEEPTFKRLFEAHGSV